MVQLTIEMPEGALSSLRQDPANFIRELRLAAAVKWYSGMRCSVSHRAGQLRSLAFPGASL